MRLLALLLIMQAAIGYRSAGKTILPSAGNTQIVWEPQPGPQTFALIHDDIFEKFAGGAKYGGKSYLGIGYLISGNQNVPAKKKTPIDATYINCPLYRAVALRKNVKDLNSWIDEADAVYSRIGGRHTNNPNQFVFPSGAKIVMGHMEDERAVLQLFGGVIHRLFIDELTHIASKKTYMYALSCVRSNVPGIKPSILATGNPGGPGHAWVKERFINPIGPDGLVIPPFTPINEEFFNPFLGKKVLISRIFIPATIADNPKGVAADPLYHSRLMMMDEAEQKAYIYGDWDAFEGAYFDRFRAKHRPEEEENALHVIPSHSVELMPWWPRWIGGDWGYKHASAIYWACQAPDGRVYVYDELVVSGMTETELGMEIARRSMKDLDRLEAHHMALYFSPDAWAKGGESSRTVELVQAGIAKVLGPGSAFLVEFGKDTLEGIEAQMRSSIGITPAPTHRISGWQYMRELMRWKYPVISNPAELDPAFAEQLRLKDSKKYEEYLQFFAKTEEALPKLQILGDRCPKLVAAIPSAQHKVGTEDVEKTDRPEDDILDGARHLLAAHRFMKVRESFQAFFSRRMEEVKALHPHDMDGTMEWNVAQKINRDYQGETKFDKPFSLPRGTRRGRLT